MARHWVGGTATWDGTAGTKWATTSGGAGGAAVPTAADDVFFDAASGAVTVTTTAGVSVCRSFDSTGFTGTLSMPNANTAVVVGDASGGALTIGAGMTFTSAGNNARFQLVSTSDNGGAGWPITTNGKTIPGLFIQGAGGKWTHQDALTVTYGITLTTGHWNWNNQTMTLVDVNKSNTTAGLIISPGTSTATVGGWHLRGSPTINANTATVTSSGAWDSGATDAAKNYNGMTVILNGGAGAKGICYAGASTFGNVTITGAANRNDTCPTGGFTVTGTLTINGNATLNRLMMYSGYSKATGTPAVITAAAISMSNVDMRDITAAGASSPWDLSAVNSGDCLGNTNITFTAGGSRYGVGAGTIGGTALWATSSGGASGASVPLPQDDVYLDANSGSGTYNFTTADSPYNIGRDWNLTGFTGTWSGTAAYPCNTYGSLTLGAGMTLGTAWGHHALNGRSNHTITMAGKTWVPSANRHFYIGAPNGVYTLQDAFTFNAGGGSSTTTLRIPARSTFDSNDQTMTLTFGNNTGAGVLIEALTTIDFGTSVITVTNGIGNSAPWNVSSTATSVAASNSTIILDGATTANRNFLGGGWDYGELRYTVANSPGSLTITGNNHFAKLSIGSGRLLLITTGSSQNVDLWDINGVSNGYIRLPGATSAYLSALDSVPLSITGDIDLRVRVALDDWTPSADQHVFGKWLGTGNQRSYLLTVAATTGRLQFYGSQAGAAATAVTSSASPSVSDGQTLWIRATYRASDQRVQFFTASGALTNPAAIDFTQLGTDGTAAATSLFDSTAALQIGAIDNGATVITGNVYRAQVRSGIDGTLQFDADLTAKAVGANTFTESSSNAATVTVNGYQAQVGDGRAEIASTTASAAVVATPARDTLGNKWWYIGTGITMASDYFGGTPSLYARSPMVLPTGDLDIRVRLSMSDWTPTPDTTIFSTDVSGGFWFGMVNSSIRIYPAAGIENIIGGTGITDGTIGWVRILYRGDNGGGNKFVELWKADGSLTNPTVSDFTYVAGGNYAGVVQQTVGPMRVGPVAGVASNVYACEVRSGFDGTLITNPRFGTRDRINRSDYAKITAVRAIGGARWYAPPPSVDGGTNYGWNFTDVEGELMVWDGAQYVARPVRVDGDLVDDDAGTWPQWGLRYHDGADWLLA